jgi:carboxymethylenebutenolidase
MVAMELLTEWVDHESSAGRFSAYLARPAPVTALMPGVVVIQEVWGVDAHIRDVAERFATAGYAALAPDLYSAGGARPPALAVDRVTAAKGFLDSIPLAEWIGGDRRRSPPGQGPIEIARRAGPPGG